MIFLIFEDVNTTSMTGFRHREKEESEKECTRLRIVFSLVDANNQKSFSTAILSHRFLRGATTRTRVKFTGRGLNEMESE